VERGDTGLARDARRRWGDGRAYGLQDRAAGAGGSRVNRPQDAGSDACSQPLRRPGGLPPEQRRLDQPGRPRVPQPGAFPPPAGDPAGGLPPSGHPRNGNFPDGAPATGRPVSGAPATRGQVDTGPSPGRQYRLPGAPQVATGAERPHRPSRSDPDAGPPGPARSVASIAADGLDSFARDLRALRAKAGLDYPELAELSHYTMKTLVSAAGGLRLPTLPVAVAYVRACGGDVAHWEERWQKLAYKITADAAKNRRGDGDEAPVEPAEPRAIPQPLAPRAAAQNPGPDAGQVYIITSAKPRQPGPGVSRG
jgi:hypothetical protein